MKNILIVVLLLSSFTFSCNKKRKVLMRVVQGQYKYQVKATPDTTGCPEGHKMLVDTDTTYRRYNSNYTNLDNYGPPTQEQRLDGATGYGYGGTYASGHYGSSKMKNKGKVRCEAPIQVYEQDEDQFPVEEVSEDDWGSENDDSWGDNQNTNEDEWNGWEQSEDTSGKNDQNMDNNWQKDDPKRDEWETPDKETHDEVPW